jgi:hypothetical protein
MATSKARKLVTVRTAEDLGRALGLSMADTAEMEFRSDLTVSLPDRRFDVAASQLVRGFVVGSHLVSSLLK